MLGVSFSELAITCLVAFLVIRPQDMGRVIYWYKYIFKKIMELRAIVQESIDEIHKELDDDEFKSTPTKSEYAVDSSNKIKKIHDSNPLNKDIPKKRK